LREVGQSPATRELFFWKRACPQPAHATRTRRKKIALTLPNKIDCFVTRTDIF
jgi:hypothetical protein